MGRAKARHRGRWIGALIAVALMGGIIGLLGTEEPAPSEPAPSIVEADGSTSTAPGSTTESATDRGWRSLAFDAIEILKVQERQRSGDADDDMVEGEIRARFGNFVAMRDDVIDEAERTPDASVYIPVAHLYVEWLRLSLTSLGAQATDGEVAIETNLSSRRVRVLADRCFDVARVERGHTSVSGDEPTAPDWNEMGLAAGPLLGGPVEVTQPTVVAPSLTAAAWKSDVEAIYAASLPNSVNATRPEGAIDTARRLVAAEAEVAALGSPGAGLSDGDATIVRLSLLVEAEASWTHALALLSRDDARRTRLEDSAARLSVIADDLWSRTMSTRPSSATWRGLLLVDDP